MEPISVTFLSFGVILLVCSWIMLIITSFKNDYAWGLCSLFVPGLAYIYACFDWEKSQSAVWMAALGWALVIFSL